MTVSVRRKWTRRTVVQVAVTLRDDDEVEVADVNVE